MITAPIIFDKPLYVWLGILLLPLLISQILTGIAMMKGKSGVLRYHKIIAILIIMVVIVHAFYGLSLWFLK